MALSISPGYTRNILMDNKFKAQQLADQIHAFNAEIKCLKDSNVLELDDHQRTAILVIKPLY